MGLTENLLLIVFAYCSTIHFCFLCSSSCPRIVVAVTDTKILTDGTITTTDKRCLHNITVCVEQIQWSSSYCAQAQCMAINSLIHKHMYVYYVICNYHIFVGLLKRNLYIDMYSFAIRYLYTIFLLSIAKHQSEQKVSIGLSSISNDKLL